MKKRRGSSRYFFIFLFFAIGIGSFVFGIRYLVMKLDFFKIKNIEITGNINLETDFLTNVAGDFIQKNLYTVSYEDVMQKFSNIIRIKNLSVKNVFPDKLRIKIEERKEIFLVVSQNGELFPIDEEYVILDNDNFSAMKNLPIIDADISDDLIHPGKKLISKDLTKIFNFYSKVREIDSNFFEKVSEIFIKNNEINITDKNKGFIVVYFS